MRTALILCVLIVISGSVIQAQPLCPADILLDFGRSASACYGLPRDTVCSGNGLVTAAGFAGESPLSQTGNRAAAALVETLTLTTTPEEFAIASISLQADLPTLSERSVTAIAFGDVTLVNQVTPLPRLTAVATGLVNIRSRPQTNGDIIGQVTVNNVVTINGRNEDSRWLRAQLPGTDTYGWAAIDVLNVQGNVQLLTVTDELTNVQNAFEVLELTASAATFCDGALSSGVLLQTPSVTEPVTVSINGTRLSVAGTAFIQPDADLHVYGIHGFALLTDDAVYVPAGAWISPGQPAAPFEPDQWAALPLHLLPVSVRLPEAITVEDIDRLENEYTAALAAVSAPPAPLPTTDPMLCQREIRRDTSLYAGPGAFYEVINDIRAGQPATPILQAFDPDGRVWWQLRSSNWILAADVRESGRCDDIPHAQVVPPPPTNTLSLETCESTNGPLRAGQQVTIQFTPPPWDNWGEARDAVIVDPGRISIGSRTYRAQATDPIQIGTVGPDDRYLRRFYIHWTAEPGTYRIVGDRLSYEPICTLTVPVG